MRSIRLLRLKVHFCFLARSASQRHPFSGPRRPSGWTPHTVAGLRFRCSAHTHEICGHPPTSSSQLRISSRSEISPRIMIWSAEMPANAPFGFRIHP